ncbi:transferase [Streptomyces sp. NBC_01794]|uniref:transferase n=1 Tax=Streptomyces sp. NBC_01794 TaxID=2975942 RepID=UPI00308D4149|nr:transferase [Streptomyces sp. NBC_01794]
MAAIRLADYLSAPAEDTLTATRYAELEHLELAEFLGAWGHIHEEARLRIRYRIHPTAFIHPTAQIGDDVIIGPHAKVHEFSSVRKNTVIAARASIGFNCEVTHSYVGEGAVLGHRIGINRSLIGGDAHLSAAVTIAAIHPSPDMRTPVREVLLRTADGLYRCGTAQFGALIGDRVQTGNSITLGPGVAIGPDSLINTGVIVPATRVLPAHSTVSTPPRN